MIYKRHSQKNIKGDKGTFTVTQYFGNDCPEKYNDKYDTCLGKKIITPEYIGVIIGFEDNEVYDDLYYIVYVPSENRIVYHLVIKSAQIV